MTPEQARALFNEHRKPGDMAHYGEKAAVAAIMEVAAINTALLSSLVELLDPLEQASAEMVLHGKVLNQNGEAAFDRARFAISQALTYA